MTNINPYLTLNNAKEAIEFYKKVFDAKLKDHNPYTEEMGKGMGLPADFDYANSTMHAEISIDGCAVMLADNTGKPIESSNIDIMIAPNSLKQMETYYNNAKKYGAEIKMPLEKQFWGAYFARFKDPFGVGWQMNFTPPQEETPTQVKKPAKKKKTSKSKKTTKKSKISTKKKKK